MFNLVREDREMTVEPIKQVALGLVGCEVADQGAFSRIFPEFFDLRQIVLHGRCPALFPEFRPGGQRESIQTRGLGHPDKSNAA